MTLLPSDYRAEESVIGAMLLEPSIIPNMQALLESSDFYEPKYAVIFDVMGALQHKGVPVDLLSVGQALRDLNRPGYQQETVQYLLEFGGTFLPDLMDKCIGAANAEHHAQIIRERSLQRQGMERAEQFLALAREGNFSQISERNGYFNLSELVVNTRASSANPFALHTISAANLPHAQEPVRLWFGFYPRSVVLLIGESGAGKSSLLYNFAIHAARNEPLYGIPFGLGRPLRILYIDPENSGNFAEGQGGQCAVKMERIGQGRPKDLLFHPGVGVNLSNPAHVDALRDYIQQQRLDLVIIDPIANLFQTKDENDNAEAARQMTALTALSRETGACIVPVHHTGRDTSSNSGRGATARLAAADVGFMYRARGNDEQTDDTFTSELIPREDVCRLQIVKNRLEGQGSLYLQMVGEDRFCPSTFDAWKGRAKPHQEKTKSAQAEEEIRLFLSDEKWHSRPEILEAMKQEGIGQVATDAALKKLEAAETIQSKKEGKGGSLHFAVSFLVSQSPKENERLKELEGLSEDEENE